MNAREICLIALALFATQANASFSDPDWGSSEADCKRRWADFAEGCRIRKESDQQELATIDLRIAAAESTRDNSVRPLQDATDLVARLEEKQFDAEQIMIPYLTRVTGLGKEMRDLLMGTAASGLADARALIEMAGMLAHDDGADRPGAEMTAGLTDATSDPLALSLVLDAGLNDRASPAAPPPLDITKADLSTVLDRLEQTVESVETAHRELAELLGRLTAENELMLSMQRGLASTLAGLAEQARARKTTAEKTYSDALESAQSLKARKAALPGEIATESQHQQDGLGKRDGGCTNYYYHAQTRNQGPPDRPDRGR